MMVRLESKFTEAKLLKCWSALHYHSTAYRRTLSFSVI